MKKILLVLLIPFIILTTSFKNCNKSYIVLETTTNTIINGDNYNDQLLVASTAKILTAITVIENYDLNEIITITKKDTLEVGSKVYLKENEKISRKDLLYALMLRSANDAASALSNNNDEVFINLMNETAKKIGMYNSVFENASGLDEVEYNLSTAYDMALLASYAAKNSIFVSISSAHVYKCQTNMSNYIFNNKHKLVKAKEEFLWGKTGYTKASKRVLVSNYVKDNKNLICVTINDSDDWNHHQELVQTVDYSFIDVLVKGVYEVELDKKYYLVIKDNIVIPVNDSDEKKIKLEYLIYKDKAILNIFLNNELISRYSILVYDESNFNFDFLFELM